MKSKCPVCGNQIESKFSDKEKLHYFYCDKCKISGKGKTPEEANTNFTTENIKTPTTPAELVKWSDVSVEKIIEQSAKFMNRPYLQKMISDNANCISRLDLKGAWNTDEGRTSITDAFLYACSLGLNLKNAMGYLVPFKGKNVTTVACVPHRTGIEFALTSGKNPPYKDIRTEIIYENDVYEYSSSPEGGVYFNISKRTLPYGEIIGVVVLGFKIDSGFQIGKMYDVKDIYAKAEKHSPTYQYYLKDIEALRKAQSEGKQFIIKWEKKFYEKDITSLYVDADKEKMIEKTALKSFFADDLKTRDSRAMETERKENEDATREEIVEIILDDSVSAIKEDIKDAEFEPVEPDKNSESEKKNDLFGGEKL